MDDFERKKFGCKGKISIFKKKHLGKCPSFQLIPLQNLSKIFLHNLLFQNIQSFFIYFEKKSFHFGAASAKNPFFSCSLIRTFQTFFSFKSYTFNSGQDSPPPPFLNGNVWLEVFDGSPDINYIIKLYWEYLLKERQH